MAHPTVNIDVTADPTDAVIDPAHVRAFARAVNDPNPLYLEQGVAPPTFTIGLMLDTFFDLMGRSQVEGAIRNTRGGVHGTSDLYVHRPLLAGESVKVAGNTYCANQTSSGVLIGQRLTVTDEAGKLVVEHYWNSFMMGAETTPVGPALPDHTFPDDARSRPLGHLVVPVDDDQSFRYAGVSHDHAPMHVSDITAQRMGYPARFMQGLCTFAMCARGVVEVALGGDSRRLRRLAVRFSSPVFPPTEVDVQVYDARPGAVAFEAMSGEKAVIKNGLAEFDV